MELRWALTEKLRGPAFELQQLARRHAVAAVQGVDFDAELDLARAAAQDAHGELVVLLCRRKALLDRVWVQIANVADLATGQVELALGTHLALAQLVDDGDR